VTTELRETAASFDAAPARRYRGKNKGKRWTRSADIELAVIRLPLDVHDPGIRHRTEGLFSAMWSVKRALQRDARDAVDAYWAGDVRRQDDAKAWRVELGCPVRAWNVAGTGTWNGPGILASTSPKLW
jgi:hypothetical protein